MDDPHPREAQKTALTCPVCHHHCRLREGQLGLCRARRAQGRHVVSENYGRLTSLAIDPIEKKPIAEWRPGTRVLSVGSYGCNLRCPFCQNWEISQADADEVGWRATSPDELVAAALQARREDLGMVGIAYTYNEPLVGWEFVRDTATLARERGLANVLVSNGCAAPEVVAELAPLVDAANIDLKSFSPAFYRECAGSLDYVRATIERLAAEPTCHLEVTTLVVTDKNDSPEEMDALAAWLASVSPAIVLHVTRFFPRWKLTDRPATPVSRVYALADVARRHLARVHVGNC